MTENFTAAPDAAIFEYRPFLATLADAIFYLRLSRRSARKPEAEARHARVSFMLTVFAVEASLNSALARTRSSKKIKERISRIPMLERLEMLSLLYRTTEFDSQRPSVVALLDAVRQRNRFAHPTNNRSKVRKTAHVAHGPTFEDETKEISETLGLPSRMENWRAIHAEAALRASDLFLGYYFVSLLQLNRDALCDVFLSLLTPHESERGNPVHQVESANQLRWAKRHLKMRFDYIPGGTVFAAAGKPRVRY